MSTPSTAYLDEVLSSVGALSASSLPDLFRTSDALLASFRTSLSQASAPNMLPSFTSSLPDGSERGSAVAMDLGGSTLRVALIELRPHARLPGSDAPNLPAVMHVAARKSWGVGDAVKKLAAQPFFDWIADRIGAVLAEAGTETASARMPLGVTWSFPVEQTSAASGNVQEMGKGYEQWREIRGTDLRAHLEAALRRRGLAGLRMAALMNDTEATLLSHAYANPATRISLIWGTGLNAAVFLPLAAMGRDKLAARDPRWLRSTRAAVVNTEVSMFGGHGVVALAGPDRALDAASSQPGFQPLEQLTSGRYLGEIVRRALAEAARRDGLFGGRAPPALDTPWALDTALASAFEDGPDVSAAAGALAAALGLEQPMSEADAEYVRRVCDAVSSRAAVLIAVTVFSLHRLQRDAHGPEQPSAALDTALDAARPPVAVAYCGAVAEKHATARRKAQDVLDLLVEEEGRHCADSQVPRRLVLEGAADSGLLGAAVGAVMNDVGGEIRAKL